MRIYDYLNGIRGALGSGEDTGVPEPAWRIEEYLKDIYDAIKAGGGGGGSGALVVTASFGDAGVVLDKTWQEIFDAATAGVPIIMRDEPTETSASYGYLFASASTFASVYSVQATSSGSTITFTTDSADGYPVLNM